MSMSPMTMLARAALIRRALADLESAVTQATPEPDSQQMRRMADRLLALPTVPADGAGECVEAWRKLGQLIEQAWDHTEAVMDACVGVMTSEPGNPLPVEYYAVDSDEDSAEEETAEEQATLRLA